MSAIGASTANVAIIAGGLRRRVVLHHTDNNHDLEKNLLEAVVPERMQYRERFQWPVSK